MVNRTIAIIIQFKKMADKTSQHENDCHGSYKNQYENEIVHLKFV